MDDRYTMTFILMKWKQENYFLFIVILCKSDLLLQEDGHLNLA